jgi:serine/threonine-protein kinase HipA
MVSAVTLLQAEDSPTDRGRWSYLLLADELRRVSDQPAADLRELFGRICFNAAVSNTDDHPRNHALLARSTSWQLSPAYDLTPAPLQAETRRDLAMACGLVDRSPSRWANRRAILAGAGRFLLKPAEAEAIATRIFIAVASSWEATLREASVSPADCQRLNRASPTRAWSWIRRWRSDGRANGRRPARAQSTQAKPPARSPYRWLIGLFL